MIEFRAEPWEIVRDEVLAQLPIHYREAFGDDDYDPNVAAYNMLAAIGELLVVTARRSDVLVGYTVSYVRPHLLQRTVLWGIVDWYWLRPDARRPRVFQRLVAATEAAMRDRGVKKIYALEDSTGMLFERLGYQPRERGYLRVLT